MIFDLCYKNRGNVLLSIETYIKAEEFIKDVEKWHVVLKTHFIQMGLTRFVFDNIKTEKDLITLQTKLIPFESLNGWLHTDQQFENNLYTTATEASKRNTLVIKAVKQKLNELCDFFGEDLFINED